MSSARRPRVVVFGTGALGTLVAGLLARPRTTAEGGEDSLAEVTVTGSWAAALAAMGRDGVRIDDADGGWSAAVDAVSIDAISIDAVSIDAVSIDAVPLDRLAGGFDLALVLVKSWRTAEIAPRVAAALTAEGRVLTLQNGLGNRELLASAVGAERTLAGVTTVGSTLLAPGHVVRGGQGRTVLGGGGADAGREIAGLLSRAGLPTTVTDDLEREQWLKLAVNCAINPLTALTGVANGALVDDPELRSRALAVAWEVAAVAARRGLALGDVAARTLEVAGATAGNRSSMLQDLDHGRRTEIDALCGAVVEHGRHVGVPTPGNAALVAAIRSAEGAALRGAA